MKRFFLFIAVMLTAGALLQAQTDVTSTYLTNADFNTNANYKFDTAASNLGSANGGVNIQQIEGWVRGQLGDNSAASTFEYGYAGTLNSPGPIPATGPNGESGAGQAALGISTAWTGTVTYTQSVTLPAGKYSIVYQAYNSGPAVNNTSRVGWAPTSGTAVLATRNAFPMNEWIADTLTFTVASSTPGNIQVGISAPNSGSSAVGRIFFDNVKIFAYEVDKAALIQLKDSATAIYNNPQPVGTSTAYADLNTAIATAQAVIDNTAATAEQVLGQEAALSAAIAKVYSAIIIHERELAWTTLPYNATSLVVNPSFETGNTNGWVNVGGFVGQNNTSFALKQGTFYVERWKASGNWTGLRLSQKVKDIPNGIYQVTAAALNNPNTTGGAYVFANDESVEVFTVNEYSVLVTVEDNEIEFGYEVVLGGNYVAVDNFRLTYISDGSPYVVASPESLFFDPLNLTKTFTVSGGNLTENAVLTAPAGISLDITNVTPAQVAEGVVITATFDNETAISAGTIDITTGDLTVSIDVMTSADLACFTPIYADAVNLVPNPYLNDISAFGGWGRKSVVYGEEAYCGAGAVKFSATTNGWPDGAALDITGIAWEANATYRVRAMVKAVDGTFAFFANQTDPNVTISIAQSNDEWVLIDETFVVGNNPGTSFFSFNNVDGASTGKIAYIDNWELYKVPAGISTSVARTEAGSASRAFVVNDQIAVRFILEQAAEVEFAIYSMQGTLISAQKASYNTGDNQVVLDATLTAGVYLVKMNYNGQSFTTKVVK